MSSAIYPDPPRLVTAVCGHGEQQRLSNARLRANVAPSVRHNARSPIAGSFLGGFRTPATVHLASPAWPASETLHKSCREQSQQTAQLFDHLLGDGAGHQRGDRAHASSSPRTTASARREWLY